MGRAWQNVRAYTRFTLGLRGFLRQPVTLEEARAAIAERLARREQRFVATVRMACSSPRSPYRRLLEVAHCTLPDVEAGVQQWGVEGMLERLRDEGVYVTFEEFKGRRPLVRHGQEIETSSESFDNPHLARYWHGSTSGSTGPGTRIAVDLEHIRETTPALLLALEAHGVRDAPCCQWYSVLPATAGLTSLLRSAVNGNVTRRWYSPITRSDVKPSLKDWMATEFILAMGRLSGVPLPRPQPVPTEHGHVVAQWASETLRREGRCIIRGHLSSLLRVALAARERSLDLTNAVFWGGGEPPTPAKVRPIEETGARYLPTYYLAEAGAIGYACGNPVDCTDVHLIADGLALIQRARPLPGTDRTAEAFYYTSLHPTAPKLLLNVESDDCGIIEQRACGCPLEQYGFPLHIRQVRSFGKLTGEGVTLLGSEVLRVVEEVLPQRCGGTPLDYQLVEEEDDQGFTRLILVADPATVHAPDEMIRQTFLEALPVAGPEGVLTRAVWCQAGTLHVRRERPRPTDHGKLMPFAIHHGRARVTADEAAGRQP